MLGKIDSPLNQKLAQVKWGEFKLSELFDITTSKSIDKNKITLVPYGAFDFIGRSRINNGVQGTIDRLSYAPNPKETFSLVQVGESVCLYRNRDWYASQNIFVLNPHVKELSKSHIFITTSINKALSEYASAYTYPTLETIKNITIFLPLSGSKIDFEFIDGFVAELEDQRVAELQAYLSVTGFDSFELTEQEKNTINNIDKIEWESYKLGDLFDRIPTKKLPYKAKELPGYPIKDYILPCLTSSFKNQGLNYYVPKSGATTLKNVISIPSNSDVYRAYFQSNEFTVLSDAYAIRWKEESEHISQNQYLFMVMSINKVTNLPIYSYKNKLGGWNVVKHKKILLPTTNEKIDFSFMDEFISAIKKLHLKSVADFTDKKIALTKQVISKS